MTEDQILQELHKTLFRPFRIHLVTGKTMDVLHPGAAVSLHDGLLVFRKMVKSGQSAEGYDVVSFDGIERLEQLEIGKRIPGNRKPAS